VSREQGIVLGIACALWFFLGLILYPHTPMAGLTRPVVVVLWLTSLPFGLFAAYQILWPSKTGEANEPN